MGVLEWRAVFITSQTQYRYVSTRDGTYSAPTRQRILGLSATYDQKQWVGRAEVLHIDRRADYGSDQGQLVAVGHHFGVWLPMLSVSRYRQSTLAIDNPLEGHDMMSLLLRRELGTSAAVKLQFDVGRDHSGTGFADPHGDRKLITFAYVRVF